jgi:ribonucleoside-diphosphate reductase alpha chain
LLDRNRTAWDLSASARAARIGGSVRLAIGSEGSGYARFDPAQDPALKREIKAARKHMVPDNYIQRVIQFAR